MLDPRHVQSIFYSLIYKLYYYLVSLVVRQSLKGVSIIYTCTFHFRNIFGLFVFTTSNILVFHLLKLKIIF